MKDKNNYFFIFGGIILIIGLILHFIVQYQWGIHITLLGFILMCAGFFRLLSNPNADPSKQPKPFHGDFADNPHGGFSGCCAGGCGSCMNSGGCQVMNQRPEEKK